VRQIFRLVTQWKDNSWLNYVGINKSLDKYCLISQDPVNDNIILDLASLKSATVRHLVQEGFQLDHHRRKGHRLDVPNYIILDQDLEQLSKIFRRWYSLMEDLDFISEQKPHALLYFADSNQANESEKQTEIELAKRQQEQRQPNLVGMKRQISTCNVTEDEEVIARKFLQCDQMASVNQTLEGAQQSTNQD